MTPIESPDPAGRFVRAGHAAILAQKIGEQFGIEQRDAQRAFPLVRDFTGIALSAGEDLLRPASPEISVPTLRRAPPTIPPTPTAEIPR